MIYNFDEPQDTNEDRLALGFMTWAENGTLVRVDSGISADYIEVKLVSSGRIQKFCSSISFCCLFDYFVKG